MSMYNLSNLEPKFKSYLYSENISPVSLRNYMSDLRHFFGWIFSKNKDKNKNINQVLSSVTPNLVEDYKKEHANLKLPTKTINRRLSSLRKFFSFYHKEGLIKNNPTTSLKNITTVTLKQKPFSPNISSDSFTPLVSLPEKELEEKPKLANNLNVRSKIVLLSLIILTFISLFALSRVKIPNFLLKASPINTNTRFITFKGKLADTLGNSITSKTDVIFRLYNSDQGGNPLYTAYCIGSNNAITPDVNGTIDVTIGSDCGGSGIPNSIFLENPEVFLGISIKNDQEMTPREKIANVGYAMNSETIQGFPLGNSVSSVPFIDSNGSLLIAAPSPTLKSSNGIFTINGQSIAITTSGQNLADIILSPSGNTVINSGNLGVGTDQPSAKLDIEGTASISGNLVFRNIATEINQLNGGSIILQTSTEGESSLIPRLTLTNLGSVGIGTLFPSTKLDVAGGARFYDSSPFTGSTTLAVRAGAGQAYNSLFQWQDSAGNSLGIINSTGKLGIGTTNVQWELQATDYQPSGSVAMIENTAANNNSGHSGLQIKLGAYSNLNPNNNDRFINFLRGDSVLVGKIQGDSAGGITYSTNGSDFAEYFNYDNGSDLEEGDVVSLNSSTGNAVKNNGSYDSQVLGVVSAHPGFTGGEPGDNKILVALIGQVLIKISSRSSLINPGDFLTSSDDRGYAMKAENAGIVLGKALESWNPTKPTTTIQAVVNVTWYDPSINLTKSGDIITSGKESVYSGNFQNNQDPISNIQTIINDQINNISNITINNTLTARNIVTESMSSLTSDILHLTSNVIDVREKITSPVIETGNLTATGDAQLNTVAANDIRPKNKDLTIGPLASLIIKGLEGKTAATIDTSGNATFSGSLTAQNLSIENNATISGNLAANDASFSGRLVAKEVQADNINSLTNQLDNTQTNINDIQKLLSDIKNQTLPNTDYQNINSNQQLNGLTINKLTVTDNSNLYNLSVSNSGTIGDLLIQDNSILSLSWELKLSSLSTINFFDGAVIISKDGDLTTNGSLIAQGGIKTNKIDPINEGENVTVSNLAINNLTINNKYMEATSSSAIIDASDNFNKNGIFSPAIETSSESAGTGMIPEANSEIIIYNQNIKENSLIYLTPTTPTPPGNLTVSQKYTCNSENCRPYFKVTLDKQTITPVEFNWLIIN